MAEAKLATEIINALACAHCGMLFGITADFETRRRKDHQSFYCPNGHTQSYRGENEEDRLKRQLKEEQDRTAWEKRQRERAESNAKGARIAAGKAKAAHARVLARVKAGVCPHCHRTFKQLAAHMKCKHGAK